MAKTETERRRKAKTSNGQASAALTAAAEPEAQGLNGAGQEEIDPLLRESVVTSAQEIEKDARISARCHFRAATSWYTVFYVLGLPTTVLAAIAGVSALGNYTIVAAVLAITVAALSAATTFLNAGERAHAHSKKRAQYESLKNRARHFQRVEVQLIETPTRLVDELRRLDRVREQLQRESPQVRLKAWKAAEAEVAEKLAAAAA